MKIRKKCGSSAGYNSYFKAYYCDKCGNLDYDEVCSEKDIYKEWREYKNLEEQGLLHIAHIPDWSDIYVLYRAESDFDEGDCIIETKYKYGYTEFLFGEFNKGWFLTKEDAEKELKNQLK